LSSEEEPGGIVVVVVVVVVIGTYSALRAAAVKASSRGVRSLAVAGDASAPHFRAE